MKTPIVLLFAFVLLLSGLAGGRPAQTATPPETGQTLIYLTVPARPDRAPDGITIFAHVVGRGGTAVIAGTNSNGLAALKEAGLTYHTVEQIPAGAAYYLVYPLPGRANAAPNPEVVALLTDADWQLVRATPVGARWLSAQGMALQAISFDPKPWLADIAVPSTPTVIDPDPMIQSMMEQVSSTAVYQYDGDLSGMWPVMIGGSPYTIATRHTNSGTPIQKATQYVGEHFADLGLPVEYHQWSGSTYPNVIATIPGLSNPDEIYIVSAHLDDMPSGPTAPGADDNASGVVAALIAADIFSQYQWDCTLRFGIWTGEEQGLNGSHAYAQRAYNNGENIAGVLNLDMIAWNTPNSARDIDIHATSSIPATLVQAQLFVDVIDAYNLNLIPQINPNGTGASDHASFWQYGYPAILGIEDFGDFNPYYHTTNDLLNNMDLDYFTEFVRASVGTFAHLTGCLVPGGLGYLDGTVTAQGSGDPIADATVSMVATGGGVFTAVTDPTGYYTRTLLANTYTVTAQAYGYLPVTIPDVIVVTDTVTTQDFELASAPTYTVSGVVTAQDTGQPLAAHIEFAGAPVSLDTDPSTGFYTVDLPEGAYTMRVTAVGYRLEERAIVVDQSQTQDFALLPLPCVLLVDDDNDAPDVRPYYTAALDNLGISYDVFNAGSGNGPSLAEMTGYETIIWFSGDKYGTAGPNSADETNLAAYLDGGGALFLSSQDYLYDMGLTPFGQNYLGIGSFSNDAGNATTKYGVTGDPIGDGLGPFPLSYPPNFTDYGDIVNPGSGGSLAFRSSAAGGNGLDVDKSDGNWKTVFFGTSWVPIAHANAANGGAVMERILDWFGTCACEPVDIVDVVTTINACMVDFDPAYTGTLPITWDWTFQAGTPPTSQEENPQGIDFGSSGTYAYSVTASSCGGTAVDTFSSQVTVTCDVCTPLTAVSLDTLTPPPIFAGDNATFTATLTPELSTLPYTYTVWVDGTAVISDQVSSETPLSFNYAFVEAGTYTVTVSVWNCDEGTAVTDSLSITILPTLDWWWLYLPVVVRP